MFATKRPTALTLHYALGEGVGGERIVLAPALVGPGEVLQAIRVIDRAVSGGRLTTAKLCEDSAARVAREPGDQAVHVVRIVTGAHDAVEYLARDRVGRERERARCPVGR